MTPKAEQTMTLQESLPPDARGWCWVPKKIITLTLPDDTGSHTAFTVHWCDQMRLVAYNVAQFPGWREG